MYNKRLKDTWRDRHEIKSWYRISRDTTVITRDDEWIGGILKPPRYLRGPLNQISCYWLV